MSDSQFMYTLAGAASTFVAILAGFYTTKIFSITSDINRLKNKSKQIILQINWKSPIVDKLREQLDAKIYEKNEKHVDYFLEQVNNNYSDRIESIDNLTEYYKEYFQEEPIEQVVEILQKRYKSFSEEFNKEWVERQESIKKKQSRPYNPFSLINDMEVVRVAAYKDDTTRVIESNRSIENEKRFLDLNKEFEREQSTLDFLKNQLNEISQELKVLEYPKIKFGFISFTVYAILGVIIPLTFGWWDDYLKEYSDIFAFAMFSIGLICTFAYLFYEIFISSKRT